MDQYGGDFGERWVGLEGVRRRGLKRIARRRRGVVMVFGKLCRDLRVSARRGKIFFAPPCERVKVSITTCSSLAGEYRWIVYTY